MLPQDRSHLIDRNRLFDPSQPSGRRRCDEQCVEDCFFSCNDGGHEDRIDGAIFHDCPGDDTIIARAVPSGEGNQQLATRVTTVRSGVRQAKRRTLGSPRQLPAIRRRVGGDDDDARAFVVRAEGRGPRAEGWED